MQGGPSGLGQEVPLVQIPVVKRSEVRFHDFHSMGKIFSTISSPTDTAELHQRCGATVVANCLHSSRVATLYMSISGLWGN